MPLGLRVSISASIYHLSNSLHSKTPDALAFYSIIPNLQLRGLKMCLTSQKAEKGSWLQNLIIQVSNLCSGVSPLWHPIAVPKFQGFLCSCYKLAWQMSIFTTISLDTWLVWQQLHRSQTLELLVFRWLSYHHSYALNRTKSSEWLLHKELCSKIYYSPNILLALSKY